MGKVVTTRNHGNRMLATHKRATTTAGKAAKSADVPVVTLGNVSTTRQTTRQATSRHASKGSAADDHLSYYFRDLAVYDLLGPEQERELSQGIEDQEILTWERVLAEPVAAVLAFGVVGENLDPPVASDKLLKAATALQEARKTKDAAKTKRAQTKLKNTARETAELLRVSDLDRVHIDAVVRELDKLRAGAVRGDHVPHGKADSAAYSAWMHEIKQAHSGGAALRDEFVRANLRLVVTMARRYDRGGMPLPDLIQEGNLGLIHAVSRFDYRRGLRFSTYACWWIRHAIGRALADKARAVRIPVHMLEAQQQLEKVRQAQTRELGRPPTPQELAKAARVPLVKLNQMHRYLMGSSISLDRPLHDDDDRAMGDMLADPASEEASPAEDMTTTSLSKQVAGLLHLLSPIEADVVRKRFGLQDDEERTFREIGDQYELSRERIRQIQNTALDKLRRAMEREHRGHVDA